MQISNAPLQNTKRIEDWLTIHKSETFQIGESADPVSSRRCDLLESGKRGKRSASTQALRVAQSRQNLHTSYRESLSRRSTIIPPFPIPQFPSHQKKDSPLFSPFHTPIFKKLKWCHKPPLLGPPTVSDSTLYSHETFPTRSRLASDRLSNVPFRLPGSKQSNPDVPR